MSAYVVDDDHIDFLVSFAIAARLSNEDPQTLGDRLLAQNTRSVNERYRANDVNPSYRFTQFTGPMTSVEVLKACDCYDYQACETDDYDQTEAHELIAKIRSEAIRRLAGYSDAKWGSRPNPARSGRQATAA